MQRDLVRDGIRFKLAERYRENPAGFLSLSKEAIDSALGREIVAELRNEGHVEEEVRGRIRLTPRGYRAFQNDPPPYSYRNCPTPRVISRTDDAPSPAPEATSGLRRLCDNISYVAPRLRVAGGIYVRSAQNRA